MRILLSRPRAMTLLTLTVVIGLWAPPVAAIGGESKSPEERAEESRKKALSEYNAGVAQMKKARAYGAQADSLFAYNYRATPDAKSRREFEKAIDRFKEAVKRDSLMYEAHNNLGYCLRKTGNYKAALDAYTVALRIKPNYAPAIEYRAEAFLGIDSVDAAQAALANLRGMAQSDTAQAAAFTAYADTLSLAIERYRLERFVPKK